METPMKTPMTAFSLGSGAEAVNSEVLEKDTQGNLEQRVADLEMRPRMPASGTGDDGNVLTLDGPSPRWEQGGLPVDGLSEKNILVWDDTAEKWIAWTSETSVIRWWDAVESVWKEVTVPTEVGKVLQTNDVVGEGVVFNYPTYSA